MNIHSIPSAFRSLPLFCLLLAALACPPAARADLTENFDASTAVPSGWIDGGTANDTLESHYQSSPNCRALATNNTLQSPEIDFPTNLSFYVDASGGGDGQSATVDYSVNGGAWISLGSFAVSMDGHTESFPLHISPNLSASEKVRFRFNSTFNTWYLDDVRVIVMSGPAEDPNLSAPSSLSFGRILPGTAATQVLALANTGPSNTLNLTSFIAASGDTARFSVGSLPPSLAPGATAGVSVVYHPGPVTGVSHSAVFHLNTDDPSTPAHPVTFSGQTVGAALTVSNIQYSGAGTTSPENGNQVTVSGIATYADPYGYAIADENGGP